MIASERNLYILKRINLKGVVNLKEIARELDISETTVRRDFEKLEKLGKLTRVQGGATLQNGAADTLDNAQLAMREKRFVNLKEKQLAARSAAAMVRDGESIFLDCGTSLIPLAELLLCRPVKIVTANTLVTGIPGIPTASVFFCGGQYHPHYNMLHGPLVQEFLERFSFDHAFIGCFGVSLEQNKAFTLEVDSMQIKMAGMKNAGRKHLLLDTSKLDRGGFYAFAELSQFDTIFCNAFPQGKESLPNLVMTEND